ncbi:TetR/AcrR family transcriptional regulator, partial [Streptomyces sp. NPDC059506]|uniref:TetR/AcrR family transcriptional regulator n=1 Tax=Streptomyces sp. NPDC059506 TaxID=3347751 RepID=UPI0036C00281
MTRNPERRTALVDAAIEVLAREGARGLTFRAVDAQAGVPAGTASNYFASRDDLFTQAGSRIHVRMTPAPAAVDEAMRPAPSRELVAELMRWLVRRMTEERTGYLALLELRLEATRRPGGGGGGPPRPPPPPPPPAPAPPPPPAAPARAGWDTHT